MELQFTAAPDHTGSILYLLQYLEQAVDYSHCSAEVFYLWFYHISGSNGHRLQNALIFLFLPNTQDVRKCYKEDCYLKKKEEKKAPW